jgi:hypothetical protein
MKGAWLWKATTNFNNFFLLPSYNMGGAAPDLPSRGSQLGGGESGNKAEGTKDAVAQLDVITEHIEREEHEKKKKNIDRSIILPPFRYHVHENHPYIDASPFRPP